MPRTATTTATMTTTTTTTTTARLTAIFHANAGKPVPECLHSEFFWSQG